METENLKLNIFNVGIGTFDEKKKKVFEKYSMQTLAIWFD